MNSSGGDIACGLRRTSASERAVLATSMHANQPRPRALEMASKAERAGRDVYRILFDTLWNCPHPPLLAINWVFSGGCATEVDANIRKQEAYSQILEGKGVSGIRSDFHCVLPCDPFLPCE